MYRNLFIIFSAIILAGCSESQDSSETITQESWELEILDSIQVDILGEVTAAEFRDGTGVLFEYTTNRLIKIDYEGNVLVEREFPKDGPESFQFLDTIELDSLGGIYIKNFMNVFYYLDGDLQVEQKIEMPFPSTSFDGPTNSNAFEFWKGKILMWYAGRDDKSPYTAHYLRDENFLELFDPKTGESNALVRAPATSKFSTDDLYDRPTISFGVNNDLIYLAFSNEPLIHVFDLNNEGAFVESLDFRPNKFIQGPILKDEFEYSDFSRMILGNIIGVYATPSGTLVQYWEGIDEGQYAIQELGKEENFPKIFNQLNQVLKIYNEEEGWSNEIQLPMKVKSIFEIDDVSKPFFGLRNDEYLSEEQDYIIFYKLQLKKK